MKLRSIIVAASIVALSLVGASSADAQVTVRVGERHHHRHYYHRPTVIRERVVVRHPRPVVRERVVVRERRPVVRERVIVRRDMRHRRY